jgi:plastocyanin
MKPGVLLAILGIIVLVAGGVYLYTQQSYQTAPATNPPAGGNQGTGNPSGGTPAASTPQTYNVAISGFAFSPSTLPIKAGDSVIWTNMDSVSHTIVSDSGNELGSSALSSGATYSHTFNTAGTFAYHCSVHPSMKGQIAVS